MNKKSGVLTLIPKYTLTYASLFTYYLASILTDWQLIANVKGQSTFSDLSLILSYSECNNNFLPESEVSQCASSFIYGKSLLTLISFFGINSTFVNIYGYTLIVITLICAIELLRLIKPDPTFKYEFLSVLYLASPPVVLLFERGNLDSVIFIFVTLSVFAFIKKYSLFSQFLIFLASIIKIYPIPITYINYKLSKNKTQKRGNLILLIFSMLFAISYLFTVNLQLVPNPTRVAFGSSLIGKSLNELFGTDISRVWQLIIGLISLIFSYLFFGIVLKKNSLFSDYKVKLINLNSNLKYILLVYGSVYYFTFFISMNFDYRLIFLIPIYCILLSLQFRHKIFFVVLSISSLWLSFQVYMFEIVGDFFLFLFTFMYFFLILPDYQTVSGFLTKKTLAFFINKKTKNFCEVQ